MIKTFVAIGVIASLSVPAFAENHSWQVGNDSFHIYYTGLDMTTTAGRASLLRRVERAAKRLCRDRNDSRECTAAAVELASRDARSGKFLQIALAELNSTALAAR